jgi:hypothetical protein
LQDAARALQTEPGYASGETAGGATYAEVAEYNIILFSSIGLVLIFYFAASALFKMEVKSSTAAGFLDPNVLCIYCICHR